MKEGQSISSEEAGMSINANGKNETFKPSDYTLEAKKEYVYEYLGLKFKLSDKFRNYIADKKIAMLDNQSPIDKELKYAKNPQGGIVKQEASIHLSNLNPVDPKTGKATRVGRKVSAEGTLVRYSKKSGEEIK